ncbi:MAG TPA: hypothetical protein ENK05_03740 [Gammaproteobacteria bacterium]|nr:hypothetical protein [Gammaproteobacteria bacterium]
MSRYASFLAAISAALLITIPGCGGGGGTVVSGIGGTGITTASGTITAFGSIFVNGIEFDVDSAACTIDDADHSGTACQSNLRLGMVVTVTGTVSGARGVAESVTFNGDVEGPVLGIQAPDNDTRTFTVLGTPVQIGRNSTRFDDINFDAIADGVLVEVSGFVDANGILQATFLDKKSDSAAAGDKVELKGKAVAPGGAGPGDSFTINGVVINIVPGSNGTDMSAMPGGRVGNGDTVEVKGTLTAGGEIDALRIKLRSEGMDNEGGRVSMEGLVAGFNGDLADFTVNGQRIDASGASFKPAGLQLANNLRIEVEGTVRSGVLVADKIEAED